MCNFLRYYRYDKLSCYLVILILLLKGTIGSAAQIDFDNLDSSQDVGNSYASLGVQFSQGYFTVLSQGGSLTPLSTSPSYPNVAEFNALSGATINFNEPQRTVAFTYGNVSNLVITATGPSFSQAIIDNSPSYPNIDSYAKFSASSPAISKITFSQLMPDAVIDNLTFSSSGVATKNYGLFIGSKDPSGGEPALFNRDAKVISEAFAQRPNSVSYLLEGDLTLDNGKPINPITTDEVQTYLDTIKDLMKLGDTLTVFINGHGGSEILGVVSPFDNGVGDEVVNVGGITDSGLFSDNKLTDMLNDFSGFNKSVFMSTCHGGGFWGSGDLAESWLVGGQGMHDLEQLDNIALYAGAPEDANEYGNSKYDFRSFWSQALYEAFLTPIDWTGMGLANYLDLRSMDLAKAVESSSDPFYFVNALNDLVPADASLIQNFYANTADYDMNAVLYETFPTNSTPEPPTYALLVIGAVGIVVAKRKHA